MSRSPLVSLHGLDAVLAWRPEGPVRVGEFLADALAFAGQLPAHGDLINLCEDRYRFAVGFAAGLLRGRTSLQPSSLAPQSLQQVAQDHPGATCLIDTPDAPSAGLPSLAVPSRPGLGRPLPTEVPQIDDHLVAAVLFTSGSTGRPQPHPKRWGHLVRNGRAERAALGMDREPHVLVGTVPVQHSYGFESTFLLALHGGCSFWSGKPFFPQDISDALQAVPAPRLLVTTPFHLANWLASKPVVLPQRLLSATAPLAEGLAQQAEAVCGAELYEIYGSTESSALASRRTVLGAAWSLLPGGVRLTFAGDVASAEGGHVEGSVPLGDLIEPLPDGEGRFVLHGRHADLINIAGKRTSLAYLNRQLAGLPGVQDAAFFLPEESADAHDPAAVTRLVAFAVAPGGSVAALMSALRERLDAIFLPRPLVLLPSLPRNTTGKLTRDALATLYRREVLREPD